MTSVLPLPKVKIWSVQENCWLENKVSGPSQDEFVEYNINNTKTQ